VQEATGQAARFLKVYEEYKKAPDVTRQRLYLETLEKVLGRTDKIILDAGAAGATGGSGVVPYLSLDRSAPRNDQQPAATGSSPTTGGAR
jgi:membrane protease subunit HflK